MMTDDEILLKIMAVSNRMFRQSLSSGGDYIICEGERAIDFAKHFAPYNVLCCRWPVVVLLARRIKGHSRVTVVKRGDFSKLTFKAATREFQIPEIIPVETDARQPDLVEEFVVD